MASQHGFRIYVVQAFKNQKKNKDPENVSSDSDARDRIVELLDSLHRKGTQYLEPHVRENDEPASPITTVTVGSPYVVRQDIVHLEVAIGEMGSHRKATRKNDKSINLEGSSPEADHYVTFIFPEGAGNRFLVVAQTIRQRDPLQKLFQLLTQEGVQAKKLARSREDVERAKIVEAERKPPKRKEHYRLVYDRRQAVDNKYLDEIISSAKSATAVFQSRVPSDRGRKGTTVRRTLQIRLLDEKDRDISRTIGRTWSRRRRQGEATSTADGVSELADLLGDHDLLGEDEAESYNNASINVRSETGASTTIAVDTLRDVFTYPVSDGAPGVQYYYEKVESRLTIVAAEEQIEVSTIVPTEVDECLSVSTSALSSVG